MPSVCNIFADVRKISVLIIETIIYLLIIVDTLTQRPCHGEDLLQLCVFPTTSCCLLLIIMMNTRQIISLLARLCFLQKIASNNSFSRISSEAGRAVSGPLEEREERLCSSPSSEDSSSPDRLLLLELFSSSFLISILYNHQSTSQPPARPLTSSPCRTPPCRAPSLRTCSRGSGSAWRTRYPSQQNIHVTV